MVVEDDATFEIDEKALAVRSNALDGEPAQRRESSRASGVRAPDVAHATTRESTLQPTRAQQDLRTFGHGFF